MDGRIGVLVQQHAAKEIKLEQDDAAFKDNVMETLMKLRLVILLNVESLKAMTILKWIFFKPLDLTDDLGDPS